MLVALIFARASERYVYQSRSSLSDDALARSDEGLRHAERRAGLSLEERLEPLLLLLGSSIAR